MALQDILSERQGFGRNATGGATQCIVSSASELKNAMASTESFWITFSGPVTITDKLPVTSNKTIDARGQDVVVTKNGLSLNGSKNVIFIGVNFDGGYDDWQTDGEGADGLQGRDCSDIWVHKCRFSQWKDGSFDLKQNVQNISVTYCKIQKNLQSLLWCADGGTVAYCYAYRLSKRFPKSVGGKLHSYNNVVERWGATEIECATENGILLSEWSVWINGNTTKVGLVSGGGKIYSANHKSGGVTFIKNSISEDWKSKARATAKITKDHAQVKSMVMTGAGI
jgi:pectate lyase